MLQDYNRVGDAGACAIAEALKQNNSVRELRLVRSLFLLNNFRKFLFVMLEPTLIVQWDNQVGDAGACAIAEALKQNRSVRVLYLVSRFFRIVSVLNFRFFFHHHAFANGCFAAAQQNWGRRRVCYCRVTETEQQRASAEPREMHFWQILR